MKLHSVNSPKNDCNRYCGPSAISILTGMTTGAASRLLRKVSGKDRIMGTHASEVRAALRSCNIWMDRRYLKRWGLEASKFGPTLAGWLKAAKADRTPGRVFLIDAGNHWQIVTGRRIICGQLQELVSVRHEKVKRRARVNGVWELTAPGGVKVPEDVQVKPRRRDTSYTDLKALERLHRFKGTIDRSDGYEDYVVPRCDPFPRGLSTCHHGWGETLDRVRDAIEDYDAVVDEEGWLSR